MKPAFLLRSFVLLSFLLSACAGANQTAIQTGAAQTLNAELTAAQGSAALQTSEAENASFKATLDALATQNASIQTQEAPTSEVQVPEITSTPQATSTSTSRPTIAPTLAPTHEPGISARFVDTLNCNGTRFAIVRVINLGAETYQSAIVKIADAAGDEIRRSDGNNEFLPNSNSCPGKETPTLSPGEERFVSISVSGAVSGALIKVIVCTEKGYGGNCWTSTTTFTD